MEAESRRRAALLAAVSALGLSLGVTVTSRADESPKENHYATPGGAQVKTQSLKTQSLKTQSLKTQGQQVKLEMANHKDERQGHIKGESQQLKFNTQHIKGEGQQLKVESHHIKGEGQQIKVESQQLKTSG